MFGKKAELTANAKLGSTSRGEFHGGTHRMPRKKFLVRLDPKNRGIGYFGLCLEDLNRDETITKHFGFLGMNLVSIGTFVQDFQIDFQEFGKTLSVVSAEAEEYPEFCDGDYLDFVVFFVRTTNEDQMQHLVRKISTKFDMFEYLENSPSET